MRFTPGARLPYSKRPTQIWGKKKCTMPEKVPHRGFCKSVYYQFLAVIVLCFVARNFKIHKSCSNRSLFCCAERFTKRFYHHFAMILAVSQNFLSVFPRYTMPGNILQRFPKHFPTISQTWSPCKAASLQGGFSARRTRRIRPTQC